MGLLRCYCNISRKYVSTGHVRLTKVIFVWALVVLGPTLVVEGSLSLTKLCGDIECQALEYCHPIHHLCEPCKDVCDPESNNYQGNRCESDCQDYIHDERYLKLQNYTLMELQRTELEALEKDVFILKIVVGVCVAVIALVVACLLAFLVYFYKLMHPNEAGRLGEKKKPTASNKSSTVELPTVYNNRYGVTTPTPENSPGSVISSSPADTNISAVTESTTVPPYNLNSPHSVIGGVPRSSPTKSESSIATPGTATTNMMSVSASSTLVNGGAGYAGNRSASSVPKTNRFRREPSESTLPDNCAYDNLSMSPQHIHYSHHV